MLAFLTRYSKVIVTTVALLIFLLTQSAKFKGFDPFIKAEGTLIDARFALRGVRSADPDIKLVGIRASSLGLNGTDSAVSGEEINASEALKTMQNPFPWNRKVYAMVLEKLIGAGAKVVVFDFVFKGETDGDDEFAKALERHKDKVVIGSMFSVAKDTLDREFKSYTPPSPSLVSDTNSSIVGYVNFWPDPDDVVRRQKYRTSDLREAGQYDVPGDSNDRIALSALAVEKYLGHSVAASGDTVFMDFLGPHDTFRAMPVEEMFVEKLWQSNPFFGGKIFEGKIVIFGPMAEIFQDQHNTPFGLTPGPEIQANLISNLLRNSYLEAPSPRFDAFVTGALILASLLVCILIRNVFLKSFFLFSIAIGFFFSCQFAFSNTRVVLSMFPPLFGLGATGIFGMFFLYGLEWFERHRIHNVLEKYVSKNVAKAILEDPKSFVDSFTGKKQKVTVLFSDIRGFTSMTESADEQKLVAQLNEYFLEMVGTVLDRRGTLQKYIGDAIMAVWGDTHSEGTAADARLAVEAALKMRAGLKKLNENWKGRHDRLKLAIGIGVNHGEVVVGNIGHPQRIEFTVLGDGVNLAARLESATKQFHTDILIGAEAQALTRDDFVYRSVGRIAFKGKTEPIEVYFLLSDKSEPPPGWLATYQEGIVLFRMQKFCEAVDCFKKVNQELGGEDYLCEMYLTRCAAELEKEPGGTWDDSFTLKDK